MQTPFYLRFNRYLTSQLIDWLLVSWCLFAFFATPILMLRVSPFEGRLSEPIVGISGLLFGIVLLKTCRPLALGIFRRFLGLPAPWVAVLIGLVLRLTWVFVFPSTPQSDGAIYLQLAAALANGQAYEIGGTSAYWPVGYPLWLCGWLLLFDAPTAVLLSQTVAYLVAAAGVIKLANHLQGDTAARIAIWIFAIWPNLLAQLSTPEKEAVVIALLPWVLLVVLGKAKPWFVFCAGLALGFCILVQPGLQFLLPLLLVVVWLRASGKGILLTLILFIFGTALVVLPWTFRNMVVFGTPVLVSTNGGSNLYRANNPLANGGYTDVGEHDLSSLSELESDHVGKQLAIDWIRTYPLDFLKLGFEKQLRFMGDDSSTIYGSLKRGGGTQNMLVYGLAKALANFWWLCMWLLIAIAVMADKRRSSVDERWLIWGWAYLFVLHSFFESASKYHLPVIWVLCVLLGCLVTRLKADNKI
ncbi:MAG: hypothetical protein PHE17_21475 [Thiothrix sp.]|uniref:hypothetical protein n=1 Tax=Thiothrix sp. TaxID=1032 RepID=UPI00261BC6F1|nr:hypothetical protein [Thiothrix sp.]MDD5395601.1 hypothetical protein [Thiothrix sp.]